MRSNRSSSPLVPAKAGIQEARTPALVALDSRVRGNERNMLFRAFPTQDGAYPA